MSICRLMRSEKRTSTWRCARVTRAWRTSHYLVRSLAERRTGRRALDCAWREIHFTNEVRTRQRKRSIRSPSCSAKMHANCMSVGATLVRISASIRKRKPITALPSSVDPTKRGSLWIAVKCFGCKRNTMLPSATSATRYGSVQGRLAPITNAVSHIMKPKRLISPKTTSPLLSNSHRPRFSIAIEASAVISNSSTTMRLQTTTRPSNWTARIRQRIAAGRNSTGTWPRSSRLLSAVS